MPRLRAPIRFCFQSIASTQLNLRLNLRLMRSHLLSKYHQPDIESMPDHVRKHVLKCVCAKMCVQGRLCIFCEVRLKRAGRGVAPAA